MSNEPTLPRIVIEERGGGAGTFVLGMIVGAGVALVLAPRSGRETQRALRGVAGGLRETAAGGMDEARASVSGWVHRGRERVDAVRGAVDTRVDQARTAVEDGRAAAAQAQSELRRRVAEAKASYRSGQRGEVPAPSGPRLAPLSPSAGSSSARVTVDGEPAPPALTLSRPAADRPAAERPSIDRPEGGSMVVQEVVITRVSTETDAGDLVDGDVAK